MLLCIELYIDSRDISLSVFITETQVGFSAVVATLGSAIALNRTISATLAVIVLVSLPVWTLKLVVHLHPRLLL